jgi:hypothetical protein
MTLTEIITIYLAIGAPFGVYQFLQFRTQRPMGILIIKSFAWWFGWLFFFIQFLSQKLFTFTFVNELQTDSELEKNLKEAEKKLFDVFFMANGIINNKLSFFEFRETVERYIGLSIANSTSTVDFSPEESKHEFFQVAGLKDEQLKIAGRCFQRRNLATLKRHQELAGLDLLKILTEICRQLHLAADIEAKDIFFQFEKAILRILVQLDDAQTETNIRRKLKNERSFWQNFTEKSVINYQLPTGDVEELWPASSTNQILIAPTASNNSLPTPTRK